MRVFGLEVHRYFDYVLVVALALAPTMLDMEGLAGTASYVIAAGHLLLSLFTGRGVGPIPKILPTTHAVIEAVVGVAVLGLSWVVLDAADIGQALYPIVGVAILMVWLFTDYVGVHPENSTTTSR